MAHTNPFICYLLVLETDYTVIEEVPTLVLPGVPTFTLVNVVECGRSRVGEEPTGILLLINVPNEYENIFKSLPQFIGTIEEVKAKIPWSNKVDTIETEEGTLIVSRVLETTWC